ncbi:MAG: EAL domain-containing protein, partial [Actinomycetota bacterium]
TGLIVPLGAWVVETAIAQTAAWNLQRLTRRALNISVNLSSHQLADPKLEQHVRAALSRSGLDPSKLTLEVTESTLMSDAEETMDILRRFRDLGVKIAIDDFGTGYSSLAYLKRLPANSLKVDKAFVDGLGISTEDTSLVTGIVGLASALDLAIVAEGVENETQLRELRRLGCEYSQGYFHSRPLPAEEFSRWLGHETDVVEPPDETISSGPTLGERLSALVGPRHDEPEPELAPIRVDRGDQDERPMLFDQDSALG